MNVTADPEWWALILPTAEGEFLAHYSEQGLCELDFPSEIGGRNSPAAQREVPAQVLRWHEFTTAAVTSVLKGSSPAALPPLDLSAGTEFQRRVWQVLRGIGPGRTLTYGQVAEAIGRPTAVRAVGGACGANPVPVLVPCHRVLAANSRLGGFSSGQKWKRLLLAREKVYLLCWFI
jgi:O-6-methylguanine DNA methyltransferase